MQISLAGRRALITGGSEGLGRAMARAFSQAGADVAILARRPDVLEQTRQTLQDGCTSRIVAVACDVSDGPAIQAAFASVVDQLGGVDILVNNAGGAKAVPIETLSDDDWEGDYNLKMMAAVRLCRLALPGMKAQRWGRIINVLNHFAKAPPANTSPTSVTRAAGMAFTKVLANEAAPHNVLVNSLLTGLIATEQLMNAHQKRRPDLTQDEFFNQLAARVPMGRVGRPEEFAAVACFLASDAASYLTGLAINVDGGLSPVP